MSNMNISNEFISLLALDKHGTIWWRFFFFLSTFSPIFIAYADDGLHVLLTPHVRVSSELQRHTKQKQTSISVNNNNGILVQCAVAAIYYLVLLCFCFSRFFFVMRKSFPFETNLCFVIGWSFGPGDGFTLYEFKLFLESFE